MTDIKPVLDELKKHHLQVMKDPLVYGAYRVYNPEADSLFLKHETELLTLFFEDNKIQLFIGHADNDPTSDQLEVTVIGNQNDAKMLKMALKILIPYLDK